MANVLLRKLQVLCVSGHDGDRVFPLFVANPRTVRLCSCRPLRHALAADACEFPDTLHPLSPEQAGLVVELLGKLHATFWGRLKHHWFGALF